MNLHTDDSFSILNVEFKPDNKRFKHIFLVTNGKVVRTQKLRQTLFGQLEKLLLSRQTGEVFVDEIIRVC